MAFSPVTNRVTSAYVERNDNGSIDLDLRVLHRRSSMKDARASSSFFICGQIFLTRLFYSFGGVIDDAFSPHISITYEGFLSRASDATELGRVRCVIT